MSNILRIITTLDPRYGGPRNGVIESSKSLIKKGFNVDIVTIDRKKINLKIKNLRVINFSNFFGSNYRFSFELIFWLYKNKNNYKYIIIHSIWQFPTLLARFMIKNRYFVYLHGSLDPYFSTEFFKKLKKQIYWYLFEYKNLQKSISVILTSNGEKQNLKKTFVETKKFKKKVIKYGIFKKKINKEKIKKKFLNKFKFLKDQSYYLYLGRFHKKKGIDIIIKAVNKIRKKINSKILLMGPYENLHYKEYLEKLVKKYELENKIFFSNARYDDLKWGAILSSKAMILSSHGENFGISLIESISLGKPILITNKVNIYKEILKFKSGFVSKDNVNSFSRMILNYENLSIKEKKEMTRNSLICFKKNFDLSNTNNKKSELFKFI